MLWTKAAHQFFNQKFHPIQELPQCHIVLQRILRGDLFNMYMLIMCLGFFVLLVKCCFIIYSLEELLSMGRSELAQEIVSLRLALEDKDATINLLRTALREQKDNQAKQNAAHTTELECHMRQVKSESEAIIKRHQKFIDQVKLVACFDYTLTHMQNGSQDPVSIY